MGGRKANPLTRSAREGWQDRGDHPEWGARCGLAMGVGTTEASRPDNPLANPAYPGGRHRLKPKESWGTMLDSSCGQRTPRAFALGVMAFTFGIAAGPELWAQSACEPHWVPGDGFQGVNGLIRTVLPWDPDGDGPLPEHIVIGGEFTMAGGLPAGNTAMWNRETNTWSTLGGGTNGRVFSIAPMPGGGLAICGQFTGAGEVAARGVAQWNGSGWARMGGGLNGLPYSLLLTDEGRLIAGGNFLSSGTNPSRNVRFVAEWNGADWIQLGPDLTTSHFLSAVLSLTSIGDGSVLACGYVSAPGPATSAPSIARWNGSDWSTIGSGFRATILSTAEDRNGHIVAVGQFAVSQGNYAQGILRWDGADWQLTPISFGTSLAPANLKRLRSGDVVLSGLSGLAPFDTGIALWDGTRWTPLPRVGLDVVSELSSGQLLVGGEALTGGNSSTGSLAVFNGVGWSSPTLGANGTVSAFSLSPRGVLYAGGGFTSIGGIRATYIAAWDGESWTPLGSQPNDAVRAILSLPNGDIIAAGRFTQVGGVRANGIARWDGETWSPFGAGIRTLGGLNFDYLSLASDRRGHVYLGGYLSSVGDMPATRIAAWNGEEWSALGSGITGYLESMVVMPNDDLIVGGSITIAGGRAVSNIARWDGTEWTAVGEGLDGRVYSLALAPNGDLVAGGEFQNAGNIAVRNVARWNGQVWAPMGTAPPTHRLAVMPNGEIAAAGWNTNLTVSIWDGRDWRDLGSGMISTPDHLNFSISGAHALTALPNGDIALGGEFSAVDGVPSAFFARYSYGRPLLTQHATSAVACSYIPTTLSVRHSAENPPPTYEWRKDGVAIPLTMNATARSADLVLPRLAASDAGNYDCLVTNACGTTTSLKATLTICLADFNCSGSPQRVTVQDLLEFVGAYLTNDMRADVDNSGELSVRDLLTFISAYFDGC